MSGTVREPIQVYLTPQERSDLDRAARDMGVSRSEALRRGIRAVNGSRYMGMLRDLADEGYVTPASAGPGDPPPSRPVAPLAVLMAALEQDRDAR